MLERIIREPIDAFMPAADRDRLLLDLGEQTARVIGRSEADRPIVGVSIGEGPAAVSLVAGAHADEPVGPQTLATLATWLWSDDAEAAALRRRFSFAIVPHINPDGEAANRAWIDAWPDPLAYLQHRQREKPGRDVEFAWPDRRVENAAAAAWLGPLGPFTLHMSLHGMAVATGAWHLIGRDGAPSGIGDPTADLRRRYAAAVREAGLELFDWDRGGEKGFAYIGPGFATTPRGDAMREHFRRQNDHATAARFGDSSMEFAIGLGGAPLVMVTELPLWLIDAPEITDAPGEPRRYFAFGEALDRATAALARGAPDQAMAAIDRFTLRPLPIAQAMRLQLTAIGLGLDAAASAQRSRG